MSPASYRAAPPRVVPPPYTALGGRARAPRERAGRVPCDGWDGPVPQLPRTSRASPSVLIRTLTVANVTGTGSASMFAEPQPVEAHHRGTWYPGELLGWRFDEAGRCRVRVRCLVDGLRRSAWVDLADVRLPERAELPTSPTKLAAAPPGRHPAPPRHAAVVPHPAPPAQRRTHVEQPAAPPVQW